MVSKGGEKGVRIGEISMQEREKPGGRIIMEQKIIIERVGNQRIKK